jgi:hypothetical protein
MPKILKLLIGFGALALVGFVWLFVFGIQAFLRNEAGRESHHMPGLKLVPVALDNTLVSPASGNYGECSGYLIQLPWPEKQLPSTTPPSRGGCVFSNAKNMITVYVGGPNEELNRFYVVPSLRPLMEQKYFGSDPPKNDYQFVKLVLAITPDTLPRYGGYSTIERDTKLFEVKRKIMLDTSPNDGIFNVSTPTFRGFQFNSPGGKASVEARLYNDQNELTLQFLTTGKGTPLPQPDINSVLESVHRDPTR